MARKILVVQPNRKTFVCTNTINDPLGEDGAQVVREHLDNSPTNGTYDFVFVDTNHIKWRFNAGEWDDNGGSGYAVTDDGSTWNLDIDGTGIDIVFDASVASDEVQIVVSDAKTVKDTYCFKYDDDYNYGVSETLVCGKISSLSTYLNRILIQFDVSDVPATATAVAVKFYMWCSVEGGADHTIYAYGMLVDWVQGTKNNAQAGANEPSWLYRQYDSVAWNGDAPSNDGVTARSDADGSCYVEGANAMYAWTITALCEDWWDGTLTNRGVLLKGDESTNATTKTFYSGENTTVAYRRPQLVAVYDEAAC